MSQNDKASLHFLSSSLYYKFGFFFFVLLIQISYQIQAVFLVALKGVLLLLSSAGASVSLNFLGNLWYGGP